MQLFSSLYEQINSTKEENIILKSSRTRLLKAIDKVVKEAVSILEIETVKQI